MIMNNVGTGNLIVMPMRMLVNFLPNDVPDDNTNKFASLMSILRVPGPQTKVTADIYEVHWPQQEAQGQESIDA